MKAKMYQFSDDFKSVQYKGETFPLSPDKAYTFSNEGWFSEPVDDLAEWRFTSCLRLSEIEAHKAGESTLSIETTFKGPDAVPREFVLPFAIHNFTIESTEMGDAIDYITIYQL